MNRYVNAENQLAARFEKPPHGEPIVGIVEFKGAVIVATSSGVYRLAEDGKTLVPIKFAVEADDIKDAQ